MSVENHEKYASFKKRQVELVELIENTMDVLEKLKMDKACEILERISKKANNNAFKIQVVGTFKNGKSTFINSFLGDEILPAYALPCTAVINEVKYGKEKKAVLHFKNPLPKKMPAEIPEKAMAHMERHMFASVPPLKIGYDEIEDYVVIPIGKDPAEMLLESPYSKVELFWPLPLLEHGVEIIDSPGLNEHATRTQVTMDYLVKADAILFVLNAQAICTRDEMRFVENNLKAQGFDEPYFIVNRFDCVQKESDRIGMKKFANDKLGEYTNHAIYFVSARNALDGKMESDAELLKSSGMIEFEGDLANYLTKHKGKLKLLQPAKELKRIINEEALFKIIPIRRSLLNSSLDEVRRKYERAKPRLDFLTRQKEQFSNKMRLRIDQVRPDLARIINRNYRSLTQLIPIWLEEYHTKVKIGLVPSKNKINAIAKELSDYIAEQIDEYQADWNKNTLTPFINESAAEVFSGIDLQISEILNDVSRVSSVVSGFDMGTAGMNMSQVEYGGFLSEYMGGLGTQDFVDKLGKNFSMMCLGSVLIKAFNAVNPAAIVSAMKGRILGEQFGDESMAVKKIKQTLADDVITSINESAVDTTDYIVENVTTSFIEVVDSIIYALDSEINECDRSIGNIILDMEKGRENIREKEAEIDEYEGTLRYLSSQVDNLIFKLIEG